MKVIQRYSTGQLVEFLDKGGLLRRVWIPPDAPLDPKELERGITEGLDMEDVEAALKGLSAKGAAKRLLNSLHRQNIWTGQDTQRPKAAKAVQVALWEGLGMRPGDLINLLLSRR